MSSLLKKFTRFSFVNKIILTLALSSYSFSEGLKELLGAFQTISHLIILSYLRKLNIERTSSDPSIKDARTSFVTSGVVTRGPREVFLEEQNLKVNH